MTTELREEELVRDEVLHLPVDAIDPDPEQPRLDVDAELADSIAQHGVLQPIQVRPSPVDGDRFMIVDGERRWRGAVAAKAKTIPAQITLEVEDVADRLVRQIVRNEGKPLTAIEEARAYKRIIDERHAAGDKHYGPTQLAKELGKAKSTVSDRLAIAEVPAPFGPLFARGILSAAAAPIVRAYAEVPTEILEKTVAGAENFWEWEQAIRAKKPVPLAAVERVLHIEILQRNTRELTAKMAPRYKGATVTVKGKQYALDTEQATKIEIALQKEEEAKQREKELANPKARKAAAQVDKQRDRWEQQEAARRRKADAERKKKAAERRAHFAAIAARLPDALDEPWSLFAIKWLLDEMHNDARRTACKLLGVEPMKVKGKYGTSTDFEKPIVKHAETLSLSGRVHCILQLLLAPDAYVSNYDGRGALRLKHAAELLGLDLAKVKADGETPVNPIAAVRPPAGRVLSEFCTSVLKPSLLVKPIDQWPNDVVTSHLADVQAQLAKFDDQTITIVSGRREDHFLRGATRDQVVADEAILTQAAQVRGLIETPGDDDDDEDDALGDNGLPTCVYCGCHPENACELEDGSTCSWHSTDPYVCSAPECVDEHKATLTDGASDEDTAEQLAGVGAEED
jgi:ParB/RepB/Spo0J family partition protein